MFPLVDGTMKVFSINVSLETTIINKSIMQVENEIKGASVVAILRNNDIIIPSKEDFLQEEDRLYISCNNKDVEKIYFSIFPRETQGTNKKNYRSSSSLILYGDSEFNKNLAISIVRNTHFKVKLISDNKALIYRYSKELEPYNLQSIECIYDNLLESEYRDNHIDSNDSIIIFNQDDKETVVQSIGLHHEGLFKNIFTCLNSIHYESLLMSSGLNQILVPDYFIMSSILLNIRRGAIIDIVSLFNKAEIIDVAVGEHTKVIGMKVRYLEEDYKIKVIAIYDNNTKINFSSNTTISKGFRLIFIVFRSNIPKVEELFLYDTDLA